MMRCFFASTYVAGLKEDIRAAVEPHVPLTVDRAALIAKIQQRTQDRNKAKANKHQAPPKPHFQKHDNNAPYQTNPNLQRIRQLRDYHRANNLCFACGDKFELGHAENCSKHPKAQVHALVVNDLDTNKEEITEDMMD